MTSPRIIVLAGPNGAGKSTSSRALLAETLKIPTFVNADTIAQGLSGFAPEAVAIESGRIMLERLQELAAERTDFAFETTLAARSYVRWLTKQQQSGYRVELFYFWLASPELAIARVAHRVQNGGHSIPVETIRRRYHRSVQNLLHLYLPIVHEWTIYNNSREDEAQLVARGLHDGVTTVYDTDVWEMIKKQADGI
jgi:predicted ABC-type ATPase